MKIENQLHHKVEGDTFKTIKSKVNSKKLSKLFAMLSGIYRNPIGSIVREYVSNGIDANREAYLFKNLDVESLKKKYSWIEDPNFNMTNEEIEEVKNILKRAESNDPVVIYIKDGFLHIRDYGIGMSIERLEFIFFDYLSTTKDDNDDEIGGLTCRFIILILIGIKYQDLIIDIKIMKFYLLRGKTNKPTLNWINSGKPQHIMVVAILSQAL